MSFHGFTLEFKNPGDLSNVQKNYMIITLNRSLSPLSQQKYLKNSSAT